MGHPEYFGFRHEEAYLIDDYLITQKLTGMPLKVYERDNNTAIIKKRSMEFASK